MKYLFLLFLLVLLACSSTVEVSDNVSVKEEVNITPVVVSEGKALKDLSIEVISNTAYPDKGEMLEVKIIVKNEGFKSIDSLVGFKVSLKNYSFSEDVNVVLLPATNFVVHEFNFTLNDYGTYTIFSEIDNGNVIRELDEMNNNDSLKIYVKEPVLEVPELPNPSNLPNISEDPSSTDGCSDTDDGKDYAVVGTCTDLSFINGRADFCRDDSSLAELYCVAERCQIEIKVCNNICSDGVCL